MFTGVGGLRRKYEKNLENGRRKWTGKAALKV